MGHVYKLVDDWGNVRYFGSDTDEHALEEAHLYAAKGWSRSVHREIEVGGDDVFVGDMTGTPPFDELDVFERMKEMREIEARRVRLAQTGQAERQPAREPTPAEAEARSKVLTALRSGEYEHGTYYMLENGRYSTLGVACAALGVEPIVETMMIGLESREIGYFDEDRLDPPASVLRQLGWTREFCNEVAEIDASNNFTFVQMADAIEHGEIDELSRIRRPMPLRSHIEAAERAQCPAFAGSSLEVREAAREYLMEDTDLFIDVDDEGIVEAANQKRMLQLEAEKKRTPQAQAPAQSDAGMGR